jgi:D-tyrosyl-tRNA(Tyr) deacylase
MRVVLTTVNNASVTIENKRIASIERGYLLLVGFTDGDDKEIVDKMVDKILSLRVFPDEHGQINLSIHDVGGSILSVSQFTLYADTKKGRRPSFVKALRPNEAEPLYDYFNNQIESFTVLPLTENSNVEDVIKMMDNMINVFGDQLLELYEKYKK